MPSSFVGDVIDLTPRLRSFSGRLCRDPSRADDLVQETVLRALVHADQFQPGSNLNAWLRAILRNCFFDQLGLEEEFIPFGDDAHLPCA